MNYGVVMFPTDYSIEAVTLGKACEDRGFDSLWFPEHTHIPTSRKTPWPGGPDLPKEYWHTLNPFVGLSAVAATTERIKLGTGICLVVERDPITLAKEVASLDHISNGRVLFGVGGGWNYEEMENHGTDPKRRWKIMRERIEAMKQIWTEDEAEYHGEFVDFDPVWSWPKPVQEPHPPIVVGGHGAGTFKRVIRYGDAWMPIGVQLRGPIGDKMAELNNLAAEAGRGPVPVSVYGAAPNPEILDGYIDAGVETSVFWLPTLGEDEALKTLDRYAQVIETTAKAGA